MDDTIGLREAANILGISVRTAQRWVRHGALTPASTIAGPTRAALHLFARVDVEALRDARAAAKPGSAA